VLAENKSQGTIQLAEHLNSEGADVLRVACSLKLEGIINACHNPPSQAVPAPGPRDRARSRVAIADGVRIGYDADG
jgi:hypothetical protein